MDAAAQVDMLAKRLDNDNLTSVIRYTSFLINEKENKEARGPLFLMLYFGASMIDDGRTCLRCSCQCPERQQSYGCCVHPCAS